MSRDRPTGVHDDGTLDVQCECTANIVRVPATWVRQGETGQCAPGCRIGGPLQRIRKGVGSTIRRSNGRARG